MAYDYGIAHLFQSPTREQELFTLYAMEQEGDLPTRTGKINRLIHFLNSPNSDDIPVEEFMQQINMPQLTQQEWQYIMSMVERRI